MWSYSIVKCAIPETYIQKMSFDKTCFKKADYAAYTQSSVHIFRWSMHLQSLTNNPATASTKTSSTLFKAANTHYAW